jgi:hypothetical protein
MTLDEFLQSNGNNFTDADLATLADWANDQVQELYRDNTAPSSGKWTRPHALIREGADLLLRRRAKLRVQMDYTELRQQLGDYSSVFYGPHLCARCSRLIVHRSVADGGAEWEVPSPVSMAGAPLQAWMQHNCTAEMPNIRPALDQNRAAIPVDFSGITPAPCRLDTAVPKD